jgi:hypothetical protein
MSTPDINSLPPKVLADLEKLIITEFFAGGPKDGHQPTIKVSDDLEKIEFRTWSAKRNSYNRGSHVSNRLYWDLTVQTTWATSVQRRGIAMVDGHPILFARRLHTTRFETYEVVALNRGAGFTASAVRGFVLRLGDDATFDEKRTRGVKRIKNMVRSRTLALLNADILT